MPQTSKTCATDTVENMTADSAVQAKDKRKILNDFFEAVRQAGSILSPEDLDIALESLKLAGLEIHEKEERRRKEEEARRAAQKAKEEAERRAAAARRAAIRAEKKHRKHVAEVTAMDLPMDWINTYDTDARASEHVDSIADGLILAGEENENQRLH